MTAIPFPCVAPADDEASERRRQLRQRMRVATIASLSTLAGLAALVVYAYVASSALTAFGLLFVGVVTLLEAFRQADRRFIAPLQARCQAHIQPWCCPSVVHSWYSFRVNYSLRGYSA